jgi:hypothetical protein
MGLTGAGVISALPAVASSQEGGEGTAPELSPRAANYLARVPGGDRLAADAAEFLSLSREEQSQALAAAGIEDPGGPLLDGRVADYLTGQWLQQATPNDPTGTIMVLSSGFAPAHEALDAVRGLDQSAFEPNPAEVVDTMDALGIEDVEYATDRATLQRFIIAVRQPLVALHADLGAITVTEGDRLTISATTSGSVDELSGLLADMPFAERIDVQRVGWSRQQLSDLRRAAVEELGRAGFRPASWVAVMDQEVVVVPLSSADESSAAYEELLSSSPELTQHFEDGTIRVEAPNAPQDEEVMFGGRNGFPCTWGYTVVRGDGADGVTTAMHCPPNPEVEPPQSVGPSLAQLGHNLPHSGVNHQQNGGRMDIQLHNVPSGHSINNYIKVSGHSPREITGIRPWSQMEVDNPICHEGISTGRSCGFIEDVSFQFYPQTHFDLLLIDGDEFDHAPGDSGGPHYYGNTAYATHIGAYPNQRPAWAGAISFAQNTLDFSVLTK